MIKSLTISNFLSVKEEETFSFEASNDTSLDASYCVEVKKDVKLLKLGIILGANASGKSNILFAFKHLRNIFLAQKTDKSEKIKHYQPFKFDDKTIKEPTTFELSFFIKNEKKQFIEYRYLIQFNERDILKEQLFYKPRGREALVFERFTDKNRVAHIELGSTVKLSSSDKKLIQAHTLPNITTLAGVKRINIETPPIIEAVNQWFERKWMSMVTPKMDLSKWAAEKLLNTSEQMKKGVLNMLKMADFSITDVDIKEEDLPAELVERLKKVMPEDIPSDAKWTDTEITFRHELVVDGEKKYYHLSAGEESIGTDRYFGLSTVLQEMINRDAFLIIDEADTSLHFDLFKHYLLTFLNSADEAQLLITTHNMTLLNERDMLRNDAIWLTEQRKDGSTDLFSLLDFGTDVLRTDGNLFNPYRIGKIGGKPKLGSPYVSKQPIEEE